MTQQFKAWITKYALTDGIFSVEGERSSTSSNMLSYKRLGRTEYVHGEGRDWHRSEESALKRAEAMRISKIQSHQKSIVKLQQLTFTSGESQ